LYFEFKCGVFWGFLFIYIMNRKNPKSFLLIILILLKKSYRHKIFTEKYE
jgi:hypothetical protein